MPGNYQRKDHFYELAKAEGYRSRAAYKLLELDKKFKLFRPGMKVLDLGCFPGGWLQIAAEKVGVRGQIIGIDLVELQPITVKRGMAQPQIILGDIFSSEIRQRALAAASAGAVDKTSSAGVFDVVLSDMSPKLSGIRFRDAVKSAELVDAGLQVCRQMLREGGSFVAKFFPGAESDELASVLRKCFRDFTRHGLQSSRKTSTECYFAARGFQRPLE